MRPQWLGFGLLTLALGVIGPRPTHAAETDVSPTAVLGLEAIDAPPSLADDIAEQLRQKVAASRDMQLVSGKDLVEVKLVFSCADEAAQCMALAGKSLDAHKLIYGSVKKTGDEYALWLKMFDVRKAKIDFWLTETIPKRAADAAGVKAAAGRWFSKLTGKPVNAGAVQVSSNVFGAKVFLDGNHVGVSSEQPLTVADVAAGKHEITAEKPGYTAAKQQFLVANGATAAVQLTMQAAGPDAATASSGSPSNGARPPASDPGPTPPAVNLGTAQASDTPPGPGDGRGGYRTGFWITLAAGLLSAGGAVKFGLDVRDVNDRLDPFRRFPCMGNQVCDGNGMVKAGSTATLTKDERDKVATLNDEGKRAQTLQWICIGLGSALGVASGYLLYKGYLDSDDRPTHEARRGLRIFPTAAASSGGILAEFEF